MEAVEGGHRLLEVLEVPKVMRCVLFRRLEAVEGGLSLLEVPEVMRCLLFCMLEAVEGGLCLLGALEVPEVIRCVLLCMLEAVEGRLCLLEVLWILGVMRRVLLYILEAVEGKLCLLEAMRCMLLYMLGDVKGVVSNRCTLQVVNVNHGSGPMRPWCKYLLGCTSTTG